MLLYLITHFSKYIKSPTQREFVGGRSTVMVRVNPPSAFKFSLVMWSVLCTLAKFSSLYFQRYIARGLSGNILGVSWGRKESGSGQGGWWGWGLISTASFPSPTAHLLDAYVIVESPVGHG